ncbi:MAG: hypothetical protein IKX47_05330 [Oscillospiraceae bacterium]|nr:hypothetical protein [Oscillospiraceae bacterium]
MKKTIAIIMLAVLLLGLLAACGGKSGGGSGDSGSVGNDPLLGTYKFSKMVDMTVQEYADLVGLSLEEAQAFMIIELLSGGKGTLSVEGQVQNITWKTEGEKFTLTAKDENNQDDTVEGTIKDGVITLDLEGDFIELSK